MKKLRKGETYNFPSLPDVFTNFDQVITHLRSLINKSALSWITDSIAYPFTNLEQKACFESRIKQRKNIETRSIKAAETVFQTMQN